MASIFLSLGDHSRAARRHLSDSSGETGKKEACLETVSRVKTTVLSRINCSSLGTELQFHAEQTPVLCRKNFSELPRTVLFRQQDMF